jgi:peptidoglycan/LPS O-acetylase OafA/YrhL
MLQEAKVGNNFTVLRLVLALMVVLGHYKLLVNGTIDPPFPFNLADAAVDSFFVVSGYLITLSFERSADLWSFYTRRVFRLYPMYAAVVVIQAVVMLALLPNGPFSDPDSTARYLSANLVLANFLQYDIGGVLSGLHNPGINPSLWTLKVELAFYLIMPAICLAVRRWGWQVLAAIFVASALYDLALTNADQLTLAKQLPGQLQFFVVGMGLYLYGGRIRVHPLFSAAITVAFLASWTFLHPLPPGLRPLIVGGFVYCVALRMPVVPLKLDLSYSVYLLHAPLLQTLMLLGVIRDTPLTLAGVLVTVLVMATITERCIERPGIAFGAHLARRIERRRVVPVSPA